LKSPESPAAVVNPSTVCLDNPLASITLSVTPPGIPGARYIWYNANTDTVIGGPTTALNFTLNNLSGYGNGIHDFYVRALVGGCLSLPTIVTATFFKSPTDKAFAGPDIFVCDKSFGTLDATAPTVGIGTWIQISGPNNLSFTKINDPKTTVNGIQTGATYTLRWVLSNGACGDYSSDEVLVISNVTVQAQADSLNLCNVTSGSLNAKPAPAGSVGTWSQTPGQAGFGVVIANPTDPKSVITGLKPGNLYYFTWTLSNPGCGDYSKVEIIVNVAELPSDKAFAGNDFTICASGTVELKATTPVIGKGLWTSVDPSAQIVNPTLPGTSVLGLRDGEYLFVWSLSNNACGTYSRDTVKVRYNYIGQANDDGVYNIKFDSQSVLKVTLNDILPNNWKINIKEAPTHGALTYNGNGEFTYLPGLYVGIDRFVYEVCRDECPNECTSAIVTLAVGDAADCEIPTVITPNGDEINDEFFVPCLESGKYPNNSVVIFNQWGDEVFRAAPYNSTNRWRGSYDGQDLPAATYFFVVTYGTGEKPKSGFIMLER
jgi:gliding motility-associated-like protein